MAKPHDSEPNRAPARVVELVVNLDDATGESLGYAIDRLIDRGALDAWATPITMKKNRPAAMLSALVREHDQHPFAELMLKLTGSFGVRYRAWDRLVLDRAWHDRPTRLGEVKLKAGALNSETITVKPEFDDVVRLSSRANVALPVAQRAAQAAADALFDELRRQKQRDAKGAG
ncbi:MAG: nickel insertion protein [Phycisphaeraceae bacterium]